MALLTTMPAREITPTPVMMMPKEVWVTIRPVSTPISESTTLERMISGTVTELNWLTSTTKMSMMATAKASSRKSVASSWSSLSPVKVRV